MRRRTLAIGAVIAVGLVGFVILDADPEGRADLWNRVTTAFGGEPEPVAAPNWGDVAERIGTFTDEERELRAVLNPAPAGEAPQAPAPETDEPEAGAAAKP